MNVHVLRKIIFEKTQKRNGKYNKTIQKGKKIQQDRKEKKKQYQVGHLAAV
jgi:hypothetical protein